MRCRRQGGRGHARACGGLHVPVESRPRLVEFSARCQLGGRPLPHPYPPTPLSMCPPPPTPNIPAHPLLPLPSSHVSRFPHPPRPLRRPPRCMLRSRRHPQRQRPSTRCRVCGGGGEELAVHGRDTAAQLGGIWPPPTMPLPCAACCPCPAVPTRPSPPGAGAAPRPADGGLQPHRGAGAVQQLYRARYSIRASTCVGMCMCWCVRSCAGYDARGEGA